MTKQKVVPVDFIFNEEEWDLNIVTEVWIKRVLTDVGLFKEGESPELVVNPIIETEKPLTMSEKLRHLYDIERELSRLVQPEVPKPGKIRLTQIRDELRDIMRKMGWKSNF